MLFALVALVCFVLGVFGERKFGGQAQTAADHVVAEVQKLVAEGKLSAASAEKYVDDLAADAKSVIATLASLVKKV